MTPGRRVLRRRQACFVRAPPTLSPADRPDKPAPLPLDGVDTGRQPPAASRPAFERAQDVCPLLDAPGARHRAERVLGAVDDTLEPQLRSEQGLELTDDDTATSRADLTLSV